MSLLEEQEKLIQQIGCKRANHEEYWDLLEVVFPAVMGLAYNGFACGEPLDHNQQGEAVYACYIALAEDAEGNLQKVWRFEGSIRQFKLFLGMLAEPLKWIKDEKGETLK